MENTTDTPSTTSAVPEKTHVQVTNRPSTFFGKVFKAIEQDGEFVLAEVKIGETYIKHLFSKSEVTPVVENTKPIVP